MSLAAFDLLATVIADHATHLGAFDRLAVDTGGTGRLLSAFFRTHLTPQSIDDFLPGAVLLPGYKVIPHGALGQKVVGEIIPLATSACLILNGVDHLAKVRL